MQIEVSEQPDEGPSGEVWVKVMSNTMTDWPSVRAALAPPQCATVDLLTDAHPDRWVEHRVTPAERAEHGYRYEEWWILSIGATRQGISRADEAWLCEFCDLDIPVEVTVHLEGGGATERMCLGCCSVQLKAECDPEYRAPKIIAFYVYPTVVREDTPAGEWVREGDTFKYAGALI